MAARPVGNADFNQADANQRDYGAADQRCKHAAHLPDKPANQQRDKRRHQVHPKNHRHDVFRRATAAFHQHTAGEDHPQKRKPGTLQTNHPRAHRHKPARLNKCPDAGSQQRHADQIRQVGIQPENRADNQRRRDNSDHACQHVLDGGEKCRCRCNALFQSIKKFFVVGF
ncbi:hypothetical protein SRABI106_04142 [Rahnella aquatilis]|nr:hypothetical protein SRABI106_04142 [Rahnella aquatilis]